VLLKIRHEEPDDIAQIRDVHRRAFGQGQEADIVDALRTNGAIRLSLVATVNGEVVGHIMYSPVTVGGRIEGAGLAPMAVAPEHQRRGIGSRLVEAGNQMLKAAGCPFVVVLGHPEFYPRFGFGPARVQGVTCEWDVPDDVFMIVMFEGTNELRLSGVAKYRKEFSLVS